MMGHNLNLGWHLPPGVTYKQIDAAMGEEVERHGRHCKCNDCQDTMADLAYDEDR